MARKRRRKNNTGPRPPKTPPNQDPQVSVAKIILGVIRKKKEDAESDLKSSLQSRNHLQASISFITRQIMIEIETDIASILAPPKPTVEVKEPEAPKDDDK